jgi:hypothetical protein
MTNIHRNLGDLCAQLVKIDDFIRKVDCDFSLCSRFFTIGAYTFVGGIGGYFALSSIISGIVSFPIGLYLGFLLAERSIANISIAQDAADKLAKLKTAYPHWLPQSLFTCLLNPSCDIA